MNITRTQVISLSFLPPVISTIVLCNIFVINCTFCYCAFFVLYKWTISPICQSSPYKTIVLSIDTLRYLFFKINTSMVFHTCHLASESERDQRNFKINDVLCRISCFRILPEQSKITWLAQCRPASMDKIGTDSRMSQSFITPEESQEAIVSPCQCWKQTKCITFVLLQRRKRMTQGWIPTDARHSNCMYLNKSELLYVRLSQSLNNYVDLNSNNTI